VAEDWEEIGKGLAEGVVSDCCRVEVCSNQYFEQLHFASAMWENGESVLGEVLLHP